VRRTTAPAADFIFALLVTFVASTLVSAQQPAKPPSRYTASCILQIDSDAEQRRSEVAATVAALVTTTPILQPALIASDLSMEQWSRVGTVEARLSGQRMVTVTVSLAADQGITPGTAQRVLGAICDQTRRAITASWAHDREGADKRLKALAEQADVTVQQWAAAKQAIAELQEKQQAANRSDDRSTRENLLNQRRIAEVELAAHRARLAEVEKSPPAETVDKVMGPLAGKAFRDADALFEHRMKRLEEVQQRFKDGKATQADVDDAQFAATDARLFSIAYVATVTAMQTLYCYIERYNNTDDVLQLRAGVAALDAQVKVLDEQIGKLSETKPAPVPQAELDRAASKEQSCRRAWDDAAQQLSQVRGVAAAVGASEPELTILGGEIPHSPQ